MARNALSGVGGRVAARITGATRALRGDGRGWVLVAVAAGWMLVLGTRVILPALLPQVKEAFDLGNATAGLLISAIWVSYAATQFPAGLLADRVGERFTLVAAVAVTGGGAVALTLAPTFLVFVFGAMLFGFGTGLYAPPRVTILSRIYPERDGTALGITFAVGNVGASALPLIAGAFAILLGWRFGFGFVVPALLVVGVSLWTVVPPRDRSAGRVAADDPRRIASRLVHEMTDPHVLLAWTAMTLYLFTYQGITAFLPTYLIAAKDLSQGTAAALYSLFFASGAVAQSVAGGAADRHGARRVLAGIAGFGVLTLVALPFVDGLAPLAVLVVLLGTRLGIGPVGNGYVASILSDDVQGSGFGLFRTFYLAVGALGSSFVGLFAGWGLFDESFLVLAGISALSAVLYLRLPVPE